MNTCEKDVAAFFVTWVTHNSRVSERMIKFGVEKGEVVRLFLGDEMVLTKIISEIVLEDDLEVLAYNICEDHVHMVLVCKEDEVSGIVGKLKGRSARYYNANKGVNPLVGEEQCRYRDGTIKHLWAQKFNSKLIESEEELANVLDYVNNNRLKHDLPENEKLQFAINKMVIKLDECSLWNCGSVNKMFYYEIYLRGIFGIFTWSLEKDLGLGARVAVLFRGRRKIGIVVGKTQQKPEFKTQNVQAVLDFDFLPSNYILLAKKVAQDNFCSLEKVLSLVVPRKYFSEQSPEKRLCSYELRVGEYDLEKIRGTKQKLAIEMLQQNGGILSAEKLREKISLSTLRSLLEKGIIEEIVGNISKNKAGNIIEAKDHALTADQQNALIKIRESDKPVLLFGVTGSGKTEIYKNLVREADGQAMILVPEIALTPQLISEFEQVCGGEVVAWHSKMSEGEKVQNFARLISGEAKVLIGTRSAVFVPMPNLKLIILDEEHEWTYKNEFTPRFLCHDLVNTLSVLCGAKLLFGSATPRLESFVHCEQDLWTRVDLPNRVFETKMPKIEMVDLKNEAKKGNYEPISERLLVKLKRILAQGKQAILFLNKRGFAGATFCRSWGYQFQCPNCEVNMKAHGKGNRKFLCHFCGHMENFPKEDRCPSCDEQKFEFRGWGTQSVENDLAKKLPHARVFRADADTITKKKDFENLMLDFHNQKADILLGTQMIAKGLDFENVELCGVILADVGLSLPDPRAEERVFQLLTQVAGRAGRRKKQGEILIQSFRPDDKIFEYLKKHDLEGFLAEQRVAREKAQMPPFHALAKVTFSDVSKDVAFARAKKFYKFLKVEFSGVCSFAPAFFPRTHGRYHFHVFLRHVERGVLVSFLEGVEFGRGVVIDMGPSSLL